MSAMTSAWASMTGPRLTFSDGVSRPLASVKSVASTRKVRIDSARETARFVRATARSRAASTCGWEEASTTSMVGSPWLRSHWGSISLSSVMSAEMKGSPSPMTSTWLMSGWPRRRSSSWAGATFLPPAVTMSSFLRPVMRR